MSGMKYNEEDDTVTFEFGMCNSCQENIEKIVERFSKQFPGFYCNRNLQTGKKMPTIKLTPDCNCSGYVTHWHIEVEENDNNLS